MGREDLVSFGALPFPFAKFPWLFLSWLIYSPGLYICYIYYMVVITSTLIERHEYQCERHFLITKYNIDYHNFSYHVKHHYSHHLLENDPLINGNKRTSS